MIHSLARETVGKITEGEKRYLGATALYSDPTIRRRLTAILFASIQLSNIRNPTKETPAKATEGGSGSAASTASRGRYWMGNPAR